MSSVIEVSNLTKRFKRAVTLDDVSFALEENTIYGLLGRNGAGMTTLMSIVTAQAFATSGRVRVFGEEPYENASVLSRVCFVRDDQAYPRAATPTHAFRIARLCFPNWDEDLAERLIASFRLPMSTQIKKLSRGQRSAVGALIGLASRAEVTFFDEPYLGLDAVAREAFYDRLIEDYAEYPRTIMLSSHLIDEVANILERVIVLDNGRVIMNNPADDLRGVHHAGRATLHCCSLRSRAMNRIVNVMKLQLVNRQTTIGMPLIILFGAFLLAIVVFLLVPTNEVKFAGGAAVAPLWYFLVVGVQALTLTFPFSQAMSITRRDFHLGTLLTAAITSAMLAGTYLVISLIEAATVGWGVNGYFTLPGLNGNELYVAGLTYFVVAMLLFLSGYWSAAVFKRWGALVLTVILTSLAILLTLAFLLTIRFGMFDAVAHWVVAQGMLGMSFWGLLLAVALAAGSYLMVKRIAL